MTNKEKLQYLKKEGWKIVKSDTDLYNKLKLNGTGYRPTYHYKK